MGKSKKHDVYIGDFHVPCLITGQQPVDHEMEISMENHPWESVLKAHLQAGIACQKRLTVITTSERHAGSESPDNMEYISNIIKLNILARRPSQFERKLLWHFKRETPIFPCSFYPSNA